MEWQHLYKAAVYVCRENVVSLQELQDSISFRRHTHPYSQLVCHGNQKLLLPKAVKPYQYRMCVVSTNELKHLVSGLFLENSTSLVTIAVGGVAYSGGKLA